MQQKYSSTNLLKKVYFTQAAKNSIVFLLKRRKSMFVGTDYFVHLADKNLKGKKKTGNMTSSYHLKR